MKSIGIFFIAATLVSSVFIGTAAAGSDKAGQAAVPDDAGQSAMAGDRTQVEEQTNAAGLSDAEFLKTSDIIGRTIVSGQGEDLGSIEDLIIGDDGRVQYLILSRGGVMGMGDEFVPIPWIAADLRVQEDRLISSLDLQTIENAPSLNSEELANFGSPEFEQEVHGFYGTQPQGESGGLPAAEDPLNRQIEPEIEPQQPGSVLQDQSS
jgi:sporulation protein YlmC with PRC-barrel domain